MRSWLTKRRAEFSAVVRQRVERAREQQAARFKGTRFVGNAEMTPTEVREYCQGHLDEQARSLLRLATTQLGLSARAFHRVLKLALTWLRPCSVDSGRGGSGGDRSGLYGSPGGGLGIDWPSGERPEGGPVL